MVESIKDQDIDTGTGSLLKHTRGRSSDDDFTGYHTNVGSSRRLKYKNIKQISPYVFKDNSFYNQKEDLDAFVKVSEILAKILVRREDLLGFHKEFNSQVDKYKISHGVFKTPQLMSNEERARYYQFVRMENIRKEIQDQLNSKGSKIGKVMGCENLAPLGSPSTKRLATIKENIHLQR